MTSKKQLYIRMVGASVIIVMVFGETGWATALFCGIVFIFTESMTSILESQKRINWHHDRMNNELMGFMTNTITILENHTEKINKLLKQNEESK